MADSELSAMSFLMAVIISFLLQYILQLYSSQQTVRHLIQHYLFIKGFICPPIKQLQFPIMPASILAQHCNNNEKCL